MNKRFIPIIAGAAMLFGTFAATGLVNAAPNAVVGAGDLLAKVAAKLGITEEKLTTAFKDARTEQVDEALAAGKITQEQASKLKERIASGEGIGGGFPGKHGRPGHVGDRIKHAVTNIHQSIATALGMTPEELKTALAAGKSPAQVAQEKGVDQATLKTKVLAAVKTELDKAVIDGKLTQEQATKLYDGLTSRIDEMLTRTFQPRGEGDRRGPRGLRPDASGATTTPSAAGFSRGIGIAF